MPERTKFSVMSSQITRINKFIIHQGRRIELYLNAYTSGRSLIAHSRRRDPAFSIKKSLAQIPINLLTRGITRHEDVSTLPNGVANRLTELSDHRIRIVQRGHREGSQQQAVDTLQRCLRNFVKG